MNKKKGYPRNPYSFERVLKDLADDIGYENIETVIEKKRKAIEIPKSFKKLDLDLIAKR